MVRLVSQALVRGFGAVSGNTWQAAPQHSQMLWFVFMSHISPGGSCLRFCWKRVAENELASLGLECRYRIPIKLE